LMQAPSGMENPRSFPDMRHLATFLISLSLAVPAMSVELFDIGMRRRTEAHSNRSLRLVNRIFPMP
jgi:hypothetical protein